MASTFGDTFGTTFGDTFGALVGGGTGVGKNAIAKSFVMATHRDGYKRSYRDDYRINKKLPPNVHLLDAASEWYRDISGLAVHANNGLWSGRVAATYANQFWAQGWFRDNTYNPGLSYCVVDAATQPLVPVTCPSFKADIAWAPIPVDTLAIIQEWEVGENYLSDKHFAVIATRNGIPEQVYTGWRGWQDGRGGIRCQAYAVFDCAQGDGQRPWQWTGADVAGFSMIEGTVRTDELQAGLINHALRWTPNGQEKLAYWPATHHVGNTLGGDPIPMGTRMRLKSSVDMVNDPLGNPLSAYAITILTAAKKYGVMTADGGLSIMFSGDTQQIDPFFALVTQLRRYTMAHFEFVETGFTGVDVWTNPPVGTRPTLAVTNSNPEVTSGNPSTIGWTASNYTRLSTAPFQGVQRTGAGSQVVNPTRTSWYDVQAYNLYGQRRFPQRVIVTGDTARRATNDIHIGPTLTAGADGSLSKPYTIAEYIATVVGGDDSQSAKWSALTVGWLPGTYDLSALTAIPGSDPICLPIMPGRAGAPTVWQSVTPGTVTFALGTSTLAIGQYIGHGFCELIDIAITGGRGLSQLRFLGEYGLEIDYGSGVRLDNITMTGLQSSDPFVAAGVYLQKINKCYLRGCSITGVTATGGATASAVALQSCDDTRIRSLTNTGIAALASYGDTNTVQD